jgi:hypothetical protein
MRIPIARREAFQRPPKVPGVLGVSRGEPPERHGPARELRRPMTPELDHGETDPDRRILKMFSARGRHRQRQRL